MSELSSLNPNIEVVSFDLWLTLIKSDGKKFKTARNNMLRERFSIDSEPDQFDQLVRRVDQGSDRLAESRGQDVMFGERVNAVAEAVGHPPLAETELTELYDKQAELFEANPPVLNDARIPAVLDHLAESRKLAVVSNTGFIHGQEMRGALQTLGIGDYFSHTIFSNEVGYAKPDARIYRALLDLAGVEPEVVVHVGDNERADYLGAQAVGMRAILCSDTADLFDLTGEGQGA